MHQTIQFNLCIKHESKNLVLNRFYAGISFVGINSKGKIEIVSLAPKVEKCTLPNFPVKSKNVLIRDLDESIYMYDGYRGIDFFRSCNVFLLWAFTAEFVSVRKPFCVAVQLRGKDLLYFSHHFSLFQLKSIYPWGKNIKIQKNLFKLPYEPHKLLLRFSCLFLFSFSILWKSNLWCSCMTALLTDKG